MDLESRGMVLSCSKNKGDDQLCNYCENDLHLLFSHCAKCRFSHAAVYTL